MCVCVCVCVTETEAEAEEEDEEEEENKKKKKERERRFSNSIYTNSRSTAPGGSTGMYRMLHISIYKDD